jgi:peptide/nickel transport system substrate-binding protein
MSHAFPIRGIRLALTGLVLLLGTTLVVPLPAQDPPKKSGTKEEVEEPAKPQQKTPPKEEEEDPVKRKKKAIPKVEDDEDRPTRPGAKGGRPLEGLAREAERTRSPAARELFRRLAVPHDIVTFPSGRRDQVEPVPDYVAPGKKPDFGRRTFRPIPGEARTVEKFTVTGSELQALEPYESIALAQVDEFLSRSIHDPNAPAATPAQARERLDRLQEAQTALSAVITFHQSARATGQRDDKEGWKKLESRLQAKLRDVKISQLRTLADAQDWDRAFELLTRLKEDYPNQEEVRGQLILLGRRLVEHSVSKQDWRVTRLQLQLLDAEFPNTPEFEEVRKQLERRAGSLFSEAQKLLEQERTEKNEQVRDGLRQKAQELLQEAKLTWPRLAGLEDALLRLERKYPVLYVGVADLPQLLAPGYATTDTERQAVDLIFESLLRLTTDAAGGPSYEPGLADDRPQLIPLGRVFQLSRKAYWSDGRRLIAPDVARTVQWLKGSNWPGHVPEWADLLHNPHLEGDAFHVSLSLRQGYCNPLGLMKFKVLPPDSGGNQPNTRAFAQKPIGSGPYVYDSTQGRYAVFKANPHYSAREGHDGLPRIREIRLFKSQAPAADFQANPTPQLHLLLDLPTRNLATLESPLVQPFVEVRTLESRRIYFLAVNHRGTALQNVDLRRALAHAINREKILTDTFRAGQKFHRPLNGPYPPKSWAYSPAVKPADPYDDLKAKTLAQSAKGVLPVKLTLKYPAGDPDVEAACRAIAAQVAAIAADIEITPVALSPYRLREDVEQKHEYDLAYYHHDYADDSYWLWPLFDPRGDTPGGRNYLGYRNDSHLESLFRKAMSYRHFPEVQKETHNIHLHLYDNMPLIPLWQLDSHIAVRKNLKIGVVDPLQVFTDVDRWTLEGP